MSQKEFDHHIYRLDPFGVCGAGSDTLNPFDFIDASADDFLDACRDLANMLIVRSGNEHDPHWNDSAELNLTAFTAFTCGFEPDRALRNLQTVRGIASSRSSYTKAIEIMQQVPHCQGVIRRLGGLLTWFTGEELSSVLSTFQRHTAFLDSPVIARHTASSSFDPRILRTEKATVYLILPAERLVSLAALQRMWIGTIMRVITQGQPTEKNPVLWMLDEMAHIGRMRAIEDAVTLMRGMRMRLWFFFQSIDQLKTCFGEHAPTVLDNIGTQQFFHIQSYETAETGAGSRSNSHSINSSDIARRLLKPEEILTLPQDVALIFHKNMPVVTARLVKLFNAPEFIDGGSGQPKRRNLSAGLAAVFTLAVSLVFAGVAIRLPAPAPARRTAVASPRHRNDASPQRKGNVRTPPSAGAPAPAEPSTVPPKQRQPSSPPRLPSKGNVA